MFNIGPMELIIILLVALLVVGPKRLPEMGRTIGKSLREFRKTTDEMRRSIEFDLYEDDDEPSGRHVDPGDEARVARPRKPLPTERAGAAETTEAPEPPDQPPATGSAAE